MGLFSKKKTNSIFSGTPVKLGSGMPRYYKPTNKELADIRQSTRLSKTLHGKVIKKPKRFHGAKDILDDFRELNPTSVNEFSSGFENYNSKSHLDRNLGL